MDSKTKSRIEWNQKQKDEALNELFLNSGVYHDSKDGVSGGVTALTTVLNHWIVTEYKQEVRTTSDDGNLGYHESVIEAVLDTIAYIVKVSECHADVRYYENELAKLEKEVSHE